MAAFVEVVEAAVWGDEEGDVGFEDGGDFLEFGECGLAFAGFDAGHDGLGEADLQGELALGEVALHAEDSDFESGVHGVGLLWGWVGAVFRKKFL